LFDVSAEPKLEAVMTGVSKFLVAALLLATAAALARKFPAI
jgi:hypothetical protein